MEKSIVNHEINEITIAGLLTFTIYIACSRQKQTFFDNEIMSEEHVVSLQCIRLSESFDNNL